MTTTNPSVPQRIVEMVGTIGDVVVLPDFGDRDAVKRWLINVVDIADGIVWTNMYEKEADGDIMEFLRSAIRDADMYDSLYRMLIVCLSTGRELTVEEAALAVRLVAEATKPYGVDPQDVLATMQNIAGLVRLIRESVSHRSTY